ncbi:lytic polysaccharide monooxygenase [Luedemannella flava]
MTTIPRPPRLLRRVLAVAAAVLLIVTFTPASPASAHGSIVDPASRNYGCWARWGSDFQNPNMATLDPMCYQAWQWNTTAMWNWNGLYREGVAGNHQGAIPDGQLCSAGHTGDGRYNSMDAIGDWKAALVSNSFSVKLWDQAMHGADYIRVYVTRQGFNPLTQALGWGNLELVNQIGNTPAAQWTPESAGGVSIRIPATASGRTGRHIVYTIWQASHSDQSYYFCSDVLFGGGTTTPTSAAPTTRAPVTTAAPTTRAPVTTAGPTTRAPVTTAGPTTRAPATTGGGSAGCTATYTVSSQWNGGFVGSVNVTAGSAAIRGWRVTWTYANGQAVTNSWSATITQSGSSVTATNAAYNGSLSAGGTTQFGFNATWTGSNSVPALTCTATA